jgi:cell division septal protein FtsQ
MKRSRKFAFGLILLLAAGALTVVLANFWKSKLVVEHVIVSGNSLVDSDEILAAAHVPPGIRMVDLDLLAVEGRVAAHPYIERVTVERNLPSTVRIQVYERQPLAILSGGDLRYVDKEGVILPNSLSRDLFDLPIITGLPTSLVAKPGTVIHNVDLAEALEILETSKLVSKELYHLVSEVRTRNGGDIVLYTTDGGVPVIYGKGGAPRKLVTLETFWSTVVAERGPQALQYVDLRFDDQVVVRWKRKT